MEQHDLRHLAAVSLAEMVGYALPFGIDGAGILGGHLEKVLRLEQLAEAGGMGTTQR